MLTSPENGSSLLFINCPYTSPIQLCNFLSTPKYCTTFLQMVSNMLCSQPEIKGLCVWDTISRSCSFTIKSWISQNKEQLLQISIMVWWSDSGVSSGNLQHLWWLMNTLSYLFTVQSEEVVFFCTWVLISNSISTLIQRGNTTGETDLITFITARWMVFILIFWFTEPAVCRWIVQRRKGYQWCVHNCGTTVNCILPVAFCDVSNEWLDLYTYQCKRINCFQGITYSHCLIPDIMN